MEHQHHILGDLGDPPPLRDDQVFAGNNGVYNLNQLNPLTKKIPEFDTPCQHFKSGSAFQPMHPQQEDFNISPRVIFLVREKLYLGLPLEHPMDHIQNYEDICDATTTNEDFRSYLKCTSAFFSLGDKANKWWKALPQASISTWEACKSAFVNYFYTKSRSNLFWEKINGFRQGAKEYILEACGRFQEYERDCPHHGYT